VTFFVGQGTTRNQKTIDAEIQKAFITMGVLLSPTNVLSANWDYNVFVKASSMPKQERAL